MVKGKLMTGFAVACMLAVMAQPRPAAASDDALLGAVGGLLAGKLLSDHQQKKQAEAYQAGAQDEYSAQQYQKQQAQSAAPTVEQRLERLKSLKDQGLITESDYNTQKAAIVSSL
jgi:membrane protease subunit (stomatin/prohibitin family)